MRKKYFLTDPKLYLCIINVSLTLKIYSCLYIFENKNISNLEPGRVWKQLQNKLTRIGHIFHFFHLDCSYSFHSAPGIDQVNLLLLMSCCQGSVCAVSRLVCLTLIWSLCSHDKLCCALHATYMCININWRPNSEVHLMWTWRPKAFVFHQHHFFSRFRFSKQTGTASETAHPCEEKHLLSEVNGVDEGILFDCIRFSQSEGWPVIPSVIHATLCQFKCKCRYGNKYCLRYIENTSTYSSKDNICSTAKSLRAFQS